MLGMDLTDETSQRDLLSAVTSAAADMDLEVETTSPQSTTTSNFKIPTVSVTPPTPRRHSSIPSSPALSLYDATSSTTSSPIRKDGHFFPMLPPPDQRTPSPNLGTAHDLSSALSPWHGGGRHHCGGGGGLSYNHSHPIAVPSMSHSPYDHYGQSRAIRGQGFGANPAATGADGVSNTPHAVRNLSVSFGVTSDQAGNEMEWWYRSQQLQQQQLIPPHRGVAATAAGYPHQMPNIPPRENYGGSANPLYQSIPPGYEEWTSQVGSVPSAGFGYGMPPRLPQAGEGSGQFPYGSRSRGPFKPGRECKFCKNNGESPDSYRSHVLRNPGTGQLICPVLRDHKCEFCGATGDDAHTKSYCPQAKREAKKSLPTMLKETKRQSDGTLRRGGKQC